MTFQKSIAALGLQAEIDRPAPAPAQLAGPAEVVQVQLDPESLKLIFEYGLALIAAYKTSDYFGEFFKGAAKKLGELAGAKVADALATLWHGLNARVRGSDRTRIYFSLETELDGQYVVIDNAIFGSNIAPFTEQDHEQAFGLVIFRVLPTMRSFIQESQRYQLKLGKVSAELSYSETRGDWYWRLEVPPIGVFVLKPNGILIGDPSTRNPFLWWKIHRRGISPEDISRIVRIHANRAV